MGRSIWLVGMFLVAGAAGPPDLLIEAGDLAGKVSDERFVVLDVRPEADFKAGHVPSAQRIDHDEWKKLFSPLDAAKQSDDWSQRIAALGIDQTRTVVIYDADTGINASRIWFMLHFWSLPDVRLLNGGYKAWREAKLPVETNATRRQAVQFKAVPRIPLVADKAGVCQIVTDKSVQILDVRSPAEYQGRKKLARRGGHIPGAINLEWTAALDKSGKFKSVEELRKLFESAGLTHDKPIVTLCQSGGRASHSLFALKLAGYENIRNYYASWQEWGNDPAVPVD